MAIVGVLKKGMRSEDVKSWQKLLKRGGFDPGPIDGIFGLKTELATKSFQASMGAKVDGIVGRQSLHAMQELFGTATKATRPTPGPVKAVTAPGKLPVTQMILEEVEIKGGVMQAGLWIGAAVLVFMVIGKKRKKR